MPYYLLRRLVKVKPDGGAGFRRLTYPLGLAHNQLAPLAVCLASSVAACWADAALHP